jgi:digeranylgeranylglycerophospholipid reductase
MRYDVAVVGASLAGLYVGYKLASQGRRVCIIDRRRAVGVPMRCGEATGNRAELARFVTVRDEWIACEPSGISVRVNGTPALSHDVHAMGLMLHRDRLEQWLAEEACRCGATLLLGTRVRGLEPHGPGRWAPATERGRIEAELVVGADGCEAHVGRWAGICGPLRAAEAFSAAQYRVESDFCRDGRLHFFVGSEHVPRGYIWVFPKGNGVIVVGAGLYGTTHPGPSPREHLDRFLGHYLGGAGRTQLICGCVPLAVAPTPLHRGNVVVVGDAARQANPLIAGGIMNTLEAADVLVKELGRSVCIPEALKRYSRAVAGKPRRDQRVALMVLRTLLASTDEDLLRLLRRAQAAFGSRTDRSRPFSWSLMPLLRLVLLLGTRAGRHLGVLFR